MILSTGDLDIIRNYLREKLAVFLITIFGSAAKGNIRPDSDVDIAFLSDQKLNAYELFLLSQELAGLISRDVDLIDLNQASTVFQAQVVATGKVIYNADAKRKQLFYMLVLKKYARLNEEREPVLAKVRERGRIYV